MFGGGRAELVLTNPDDLLNTGIEIEAQPPGKKLQSLSILLILWSGDVMRLLQQYFITGLINIS